MILSLLCWYQVNLVDTISLSRKFEKSTTWGCSRLFSSTAHPQLINSIIFKILSRQIFLCHTWISRFFRLEHGIWNGLHQLTEYGSSTFQKYGTVQRYAQDYRFNDTTQPFLPIFWDMQWVTLSIVSCL